MTKKLDLEKAFLQKIETLYDIEKELEKALPKMTEAAKDPELAAGFATHLEETRKQSERLEEILGMLDSPVKKHTSEAIRGLVADGKKIIDAKAPEALKDAMLAGAARSVEHYEMGCYMSAIEEAKGLGLSKVVELLSETLSEETEADAKLAIASEINLKMAAVEDSESEE